MLNKFMRRSNAVALADQAMVSGSNFLTNLLLARALGLDGFGNFWLVWLVVLFASGLVSAIVIAPMQQWAGKEEPDVLASIAVQVWVLFAVLGIVVGMPLLKGVGIWYPGLTAAGIILILANCIAYTANEFLRKLFFVLGKPRRSLWLDGLSYALQLLGLAIAFFYGLGSVQGALLIILASNCISALYGFAQVRGIRFRPLQAWHWFILFCRQGKWLFSAAVLQWFAGNWFLLTAGTMLQPAVVGSIRLAQNCIGVTHVLFLSLENAVPVSGAMLLHVHGPGTMLRYLLKMMGVTLLLLLPVLGALTLFQNPILQVLYGTAQLTDAAVLPLFCLLYVFVFIGTYLRFLSRIVNKTGVQFLAYLVAGTFSLIAAPWLVTTWQAPGVLYGMIAAQLVTLTCFSVVLKNELKQLWKLFTWRLARPTPTV